MRVDGAADGREVVRHADQEDFMPQLLDGIAHVELGLAQLALLFVEVRGSPAAGSSASMITRSFFLEVGFFFMPGCGKH